MEEEKERHDVPEEVKEDSKENKIEENKDENMSNEEKVEKPEQKEHKEEKVKEAEEKFQEPKAGNVEKDNEEKKDTVKGSKPIKSKTNWKKIGIYAGIIIAIILLFYTYRSFTSPTGNVIGVDEKVKVDFYVMSQCPYGLQVEDAVAPVLAKMGDSIDFNLNFIANEQGDTFRSLHGEPEWKGNIVQLCAAKYDPDKYMDMVVCMNKNVGAIPGNWEECASENSLDVSSIKSCYEGEEGKELLRENIKLAQEVGATGSPTIYVNDQKYQGGRTENDFMRSFCNFFETARPETCSEIPEPVKVNLVVLNDERCAECDVSRLVVQLKSIFPGLDVEYVDYMDEEGKQLFQDTQVNLLPAILFDETVEEGEGYTNVQNYLVETGDYKSLKIGAQFDPTKEICDNGIDDTGNGLIDCADPQCEGDFGCRKEIKEHLQVFIMSDCPYGIKAIEALKPVVDNFGDDINYEVHYIANEDGDGFRSLHGQYEVDENIVQLCVNKYSDEEYMDYMYCRATKGVKGKDWKTCAEETNVDVEKVEECFNGDEGKELLREDIKIAQSLGIGASPTWLANNKYKFSGIDSETVKTNYCKHNQELAGCVNTLSSDTGGVAEGSC